MPWFYLVLLTLLSGLPLFMEDEVGRAVGHGHAGAYGPEHLQIVVAVAKGHGVGLRDAIGLQYGGDAVALASGSGDDVHGAVPPGGDLGSAHILQDAQVSLSQTSRHILPDAPVLPPQE